MAVTRLMARRVEKPWGRRDLLPALGDVPPGGAPVGEIWFEDPRGRALPLLVKYLFTSEKLSIQVHPDDALARTCGLASGKDEAWVVLHAEPDATIGIGLRQPVAREELRTAARDGSIAQMLDWRPARAGDVYYSPAGTVHSLGSGLKLVEVQQSADVTYRLFDFGRPRELHLDQAVAAARPQPYASPFVPYADGAGREILAEGLKFVLERWHGARDARLEASRERPMWLVPLTGRLAVDELVLDPGTAWLVEAPAQLTAGAGSDLLVAYAGAARASI